jgi:hypothetical protein
VTVAVSESTKAWCAARGQALITYNPWLDQSLCRCGWRREQGDQPQDMEAKRAVFHDHGVNDPCRCYAGGKHDTD